MSHRPGPEAAAQCGVRLGLILGIDSPSGKASAVFHVSRCEKTPRKGWPLQPVFLRFGRIFQRPQVGRLAFGFQPGAAYGGAVVVVLLGVGSRSRRVHTGCAVNLTPRARATFITVSKRGFAPGARAL